MATSRMRKTAGRMGNGHCPEVVEGEKGLRSLSEVVMGLSASMMWWCGVLVGGRGRRSSSPRGASGELVSLCLPPSPWSLGCMLCLPAARSSVETDGLDEVCDGKRPAASVRGEPMERRWSCPTTATTTATTRQPGSQLQPTPSG